jgi:hypothetical protein
LCGQAGSFEQSISLTLVQGTPSKLVAGAEGGTVATAFVMSSPARLGRAFVLYRPPSGKTLGRFGQSAGSCACACVCVCVCRRCRLVLGAIRCPVHAQTGPKQQASLHEVTSWSLCCLSVCLSVCLFVCLSVYHCHWDHHCSSAPLARYPIPPIPFDALCLAPLASHVRRPRIGCSPLRQAQEPTHQRHNYERPSSTLHTQRTR